MTATLYKECPPNIFKPYTNHCFSWTGLKATLTRVHNMQESAGPGGWQQAVPEKGKLLHEPAWHPQRLSYASHKEEQVALHLPCATLLCQTGYLKNKANMHDCQDGQVLTWASLLKGGITSSGPGRMRMGLTASEDHSTIPCPHGTCTYCCFQLALSLSLG